MTSINSIKKIISNIKSELKDIYPREEIDSFIYLIFEDVLGFTRTQVLISPDIKLKQADVNRIKEITRELKQQKPIQHIIGKTIFYELPFKTSENALIPRPETEELVNWLLSDHQNTDVDILDIGTGSGCIAVSIAKNLPQAKVLASDISEQALELAKENSRLNNVQVEFMKMDILDPSIKINKKLDVIISNPPYITNKEKKLMQRNVLDYEPGLALFVPDEDPLLFYKSIINFGKKHLKSGGQIYFEINEVYGEETLKLFEKEYFGHTSLKKDVNGKSRMIKSILK